MCVACSLLMDEAAGHCSYAVGVGMREGVEGKGKVVGYVHKRYRERGRETITIDPDGLEVRMT